VQNSKSAGVTGSEAMPRENKCFEAFLPTTCGTGERHVTLTHTCISLLVHDRTVLCSALPVLLQRGNLANATLGQSQGLDANEKGGGPRISMCAWGMRHGWLMTGNCRHCQHEWHWPHPRDTKRPSQPSSRRIGRTNKQKESGIRATMADGAYNRVRAEAGNREILR